MSLAAVSICIIAYLSAGVFPFTLPISLLEHHGQRTPYHVVLFGLSLALIPFVIHAFRFRQLSDVVLAIVGLGLLVLLQMVPNEVRGHDALACMLMILAGILTITIAQRLEFTWLKILALGSFIASTLLFSQNMLVIGLAESWVLASAMVAMNVTCLEQSDQHNHPQWSTALFSANKGWRPGMGAGLAWGLFCLWVTGISGMFEGGSGILVGPIVAITCALVGYVSWHQDSFWIRSLIRLVSFTLILLVLSIFHCAQLQLSTVLPAAFVMSTMMAMLFLVDVYAE